VYISYQTVKSGLYHHKILYGYDVYVNTYGGKEMLELYDRKFILTTEDGKLVNTYHDFSEAQVDAKHLSEVHNDEKFLVWQLDSEGILEGDSLTRKYSLKETFSFTGQEEEEKTDEEQQSEED
jgi:hypothetical protein